MFGETTRVLWRDRDGAFGETRWDLWGDEISSKLLSVKVLLCLDFVKTVLLRHESASYS
jgi:hypothetical protein